LTPSAGLKGVHRILTDSRRAVRDDATIVPAARPAVPTDIASLVKRMSGLHTNSTMKTFGERARKTVVKLFGNVAVAMGGFEAVADGARSRGVNAFLFIREGDDWQIAAMAWDNETPATPLPEEFCLEGLGIELVLKGEIRLRDDMRSSVADAQVESAI